MLMNKRKYLYWTPCVTHCIDLMLEDIEKLKGIHEIIAKERTITSIIYNSTQAVNILRSYTDGHDYFALGLLDLPQNTKHWRASSSTMLNYRNVSLILDSYLP